MTATMAAVGLFGQTLPSSTKVLSLESSLEKWEPMESYSGPGECPYELEQAARFWKYVAPPPTSRETALRHGKWIKRRETMISVLGRMGVGETRYWNFRHCGSSAWIERAVGEDRVRVRANLCHDRFCLACADDRAWRLSKGLEELCDKSWTKLLTLTLKHTDQPLEVQIRRLLEGFALMRSRPLWKQRVQAGAYFVEFHRAESDGLWHVHLHAVLKCDYIPVMILSDQWLQATGDSHVVDIQLARSGAKVRGYAAKYASKGFDRSIYDDEGELFLLVTALRGVRLWGTFGSWRGVRLVDGRDLDTKWEGVCSVESAIERAGRGDLGCRALLMRIAGLTELAAEWVDTRDEPPPEPPW